MFVRRFDGVSGNKSHVIIVSAGTNIMDLRIIVLKKRGDLEMKPANKGV